MNLLRSSAPTVPAHMLLLVSNWKYFLFMFSLSSLGSVQSLSLPLFFPTVFRAVAQTAGFLILQIMPSAVMFYSFSTGLFSPQKMSQHHGLSDRCCILHCHVVVCAPKQSHSHESARGLVAWCPPAWFLCLTAMRAGMFLQDGMFLQVVPAGDCPWFMFP